MVSHGDMQPHTWDLFLNWRRGGLFRDVMPHLEIWVSFGDVVTHFEVWGAHLEIWSHLRKC